MPTEENDDWDVEDMGAKVTIVRNEALLAAWDKVIADGEWENYPDANCKKCDGTGWVEEIDWVPAPFGHGNVPMPTYTTCLCTWQSEEVDPGRIGCGYDEN